MKTDSVCRDFPNQLMLECEIPSAVKAEIEAAVATWNKRHKGLLVSTVGLERAPEQYRLRFGFLPDLDEKAVADFKVALEPLIGEVVLKPMTYGPHNLVRIPLYSLGGKD